MRAASVSNFVTVWAWRISSAGRAWADFRGGACFSGSWCEARQVRNVQVATERRRAASESDVVDL